MKINVSITEEDYMKFNEYTLSQQGYGKHMMLLYKIIIPLIAAAIVVLHLLSGVNMKFILIEAAALGILSAVWLKIGPKLYQRSMRRNIMYIKKSGKLPYHERAELEWTDDELIETTENSITRIPYDQITSVEETDDYWYLYYGAAQAIIVPKRDIRAQLPELEQVLRGRQR